MEKTSRINLPNVLSFFFLEGKSLSYMGITQPTYNWETFFPTHSAHNTAFDFPKTFFIRTDLNN